MILQCFITTPDFGIFGIVGAALIAYKVIVKKLDQWGG
jgi:hypothetical protein